MSTPAAIYRALLAKALSYAVNVLGPSLVTRKMRAVDEGLDDAVIDLADEQFLREILL
jgi:hypothetical protein